MSEYPILFCLLAIIFPVYILLGGSGEKSGMGRIPYGVGMQLSWAKRFFRIVLQGYILLLSAHGVYNSISNSNVSNGKLTICRSVSF